MLVQGCVMPKKRFALGEIKDRKDIDDLTIRQLKVILVTNFVDYKGCCEKQELVERVHRLWIETKSKGQSSGI